MIIQVNIVLRRTFSDDNLTVVLNNLNRSCKASCVVSVGGITSLAFDLSGQQKNCFSCLSVKP